MLWLIWLAWRVFPFFPHCCICFLSQTFPLSKRTTFSTSRRGKATKQKFCLFKKAKKIALLLPSLNMKIDVKLLEDRCKLDIHLMQCRWNLIDDLIRSNIDSSVQACSMFTALLKDDAVWVKEGISAVRKLWLLLSYKLGSTFYLWPLVWTMNSRDMSTAQVLFNAHHWLQSSSLSFSCPIHVFGFSACHFLALVLLKSPPWLFNI